MEPPWSAPRALATNQCKPTRLSIGFEIGSSYFIDDGRLLMRFYDGVSDQTNHTYALTYVPGERLMKQPLYVLISGRTGSAAEEFASHVRHFELGTLVGDATYGAAHNNRFIPIAPEFVLSLSVGRPIHPVTGSNWEGQGVQPHVPAAPEQAKQRAHKLALETLITQARDAGEEETAAGYAWTLDYLTTLDRPYTHRKSSLKNWAGRYADDRTLTLRDGRLYYQQGRRLPVELVGMTSGMFVLEGGDATRLRMVAKGDDVHGFELVTQRGEPVLYKRLK